MKTITISIKDFANKGIETTKTWNLPDYVAPTRVYVEYYDGEAVVLVRRGKVKSPKTDYLLLKSGTLIDQNKPLNEDCLWRFYGVLRQRSLEDLLLTCSNYCDVMKSAHVTPDMTVGDMVTAGKTVKTALHVIDARKEAVDAAKVVESYYTRFNGKVIALVKENPEFFAGKVDLVGKFFNTIGG